MLFEKKCREQNGSQPVWFHRDNFIMQTQHRIYVGKIYRTLELLPASTVSTPRCARNWLSKTWSSPKMLLTSSKLYEITSQASTEQVWKLLKQETSLAPKVDEISEERVSECEQACTKRKRKYESSMCRASSTLQCSCFSYGYQPNLFDHFWHQQQQQKRKNSSSSIKDLYKKRIRMSCSKSGTRLRLILLNIQLFICGLVMGGKGLTFACYVAYFSISKNFIWSHEPLRL